MNVRPATSTDIPFLAQGFLETHDRIEATSVDDYVERLKKDILVEKPRAHAYIFEQDGSPVGYTVYSHGYFVSWGAILWVSQAYIIPQARGFLLQSIVDWLQARARELDTPHLVWCTELNNTRLPDLWTRGGARELTDHFSFWCIPSTED